ncbi:rhodanese-like domain-containing protein [Kiritimatiellota bacterium B12222]|nr:rhodanese-like domain-containing protein [Kiritimatiellota bacterium B12222]
MTTLLVVAVLSAVLSGGLSGKVVLSSDVKAFDVALQAEDRGIETVDTAQMKEMVASGAYLILDARLPSEYEKSHIPTAKSVSIQFFEESFPEVLPLLSEGGPVVVYCTGPFCDDGLRLIERMQEIGFYGAMLYVDGMEGWYDE